jgi:hypothetical protein
VGVQTVIAQVRIILCLEKLPTTYSVSIHEKQLNVLGVCGNVHSRQRIIFFHAIPASTPST